jgi:hypothetical protein
VLEQPVVITNKPGAAGAVGMQSPAVTSARRHPHFDAPTLKELGYDVDYYLWIGFFAPKATPAPVVKGAARGGPAGGGGSGAQERAREDPEPEAKQAPKRSWRYVHRVTAPGSRPALSG